VAFNLSLDPFSALEKWKEWTRIKDWIALGIELFCSFLFSGCFSAGVALAAHRPKGEAFGEALISAVTMAVLVWRRSDLTRGMMLALPEKEAEAEMSANTQVITK
jgi:hypothetical protein